MNYSPHGSTMFPNVTSRDVSTNACLGSVGCVYICNWEKKETKMEEQCYSNCVHAVLLCSYRIVDQNRTMWTAVILKMSQWSMSMYDDEYKENNIWTITISHQYIGDDGCMHAIHTHTKKSSCKHRPRRESGHPQCECVCVSAWMRPLRSFNRAANY